MNSNMSRWQRSKLLWFLMRDSRIPLAVRAAIPAGVLLYVLSPIDLVPDFIVGLGQIDDLAIVLIGIGMLMSFVQRFAPGDVVEGHISRLFSTAKVPVRSERFYPSETMDAEFREYRDR